MTATKTGKPVNAVDFLMGKYVNGRPEQELLLCEEAENARIAEAVYNMREEAGLSQMELAKRIGTQKSAISRIEDADYQGHSLGMLKRIAEVLGYRVNLSFQKIGGQEPVQIASSISRRITGSSLRGPGNTRNQTTRGWAAKSAGSSLKRTGAKSASRTAAKAAKKK